jgi:hypothetical protein
MSRPTMTITSRSSLSAGATHEHAYDALFSTWPQLTGGDGELGEPGKPDLMTSKSMAPKNSRARIALPEAAPSGVIGQGRCTIKSKHGPLVASFGWGFLPF